MKSLGLNYVGLKYYQEYSTYGKVPVATIQTELNKAADATRNINVYLTNGYDQNPLTGLPYYPKRWLYQVEKLNENSLNDFSNVSTGQPSFDDNTDLNVRALTHWNLAPPPEGIQNYLSLIPGTHFFGIVASNLREKNLQPDGLNYYLKIRMRLPFATGFPLPDVNVVTVRLTGTTYGRTIKANEFNDNNWKEIRVTSFNKTTSGPSVYNSSVNESDVYNFNDPNSTVQVENYSIKPGKIKTPYDIEIEWHGYAVDIDYIAIDDEAANSLYTSAYDARINDFAVKYKTYSAMANFVVWDEPKIENHYPINKIQSILNNSGVGNKYPLCYRWYATWPTKRFLHETGIAINLPDIYPIPYYYYGTTTPFVTPNGPNYTLNYTPDVQLRLQSDLIPWLSDAIINSKTFNKPFWYTVQTHKWAVLDPGGDHTKDQLVQREPSAYEIRAMVNLGVCYGAKGINYYMYTNNSDPGPDSNRIGLLNSNSGSSMPRYADAYGYPKWKTIKELNQKLAGSLGQTLLNLTWFNAWSIHQIPSNNLPAGPYVGDYIKSVTTNVDPIAQRYVELGAFRNNSNPSVDYFMTVNRRTKPDESRLVRVNFDNTTSQFQVCRYDNSQYWIITQTGGTFADNLQPGEGMLYYKYPIAAPPAPTNLSYIVNANCTPTISWTASPDLDVVRYDIYRDGVLVGSTNGTSYNDPDLYISSYNPNSAFYTIKAIDVTNTASGFSSSLRVRFNGFQKNGAIDDGSIPTEYTLSQNYPNPFNPSTTINYQIPKDGFVTMRVYDVLGREMSTLVNEYKSAGRYTVSLDASKFSSGVYIYKFTSQPADGGQKNIFTDVKEMMLVK